MEEDVILLDGKEVMRLGIYYDGEFASVRSIKGHGINKAVALSCLITIRLCLYGHGIGSGFMEELLECRRH